MADDIWGDGGGGGQFHSWLETPPTSSKTSEGARRINIADATLVFLRGDVKASLFSFRDVFGVAGDAVDQSDEEMSLFSNECDDFVLDKSRRELRRTKLLKTSLLLCVTTTHGVSCKRLSLNP